VKLVPAAQTVNQVYRPAALCAIARLLVPAAITVMFQRLEEFTPEKRSLAHAAARDPPSGSGIIP